MENRLHWQKSIEGLYNQKLEGSFGTSGTEQLKQRMTEKAATPRQLRKILKSKSQNELFTSDPGIDQGSKEDIILQLQTSQSKFRQKALEDATDLHQYINHKINAMGIVKDENTKGSVIDPINSGDPSMILKAVRDQFDHILHQSIQNNEGEKDHRVPASFIDGADTQAFEVSNDDSYRKEKVIAYLDLEDKYENEFQEMYEKYAGGVFPVPHHIWRRLLKEMSQEKEKLQETILELEKRNQSEKDIVKNLSEKVIQFQRILSEIKIEKQQPLQKVKDDANSFSLIINEVKSNNFALQSKHDNESKEEAGNLYIQIQKKDGDNKNLKVENNDLFSKNRQLKQEIVETKMLLDAALKASITISYNLKELEHKRDQTQTEKNSLERNLDSMNEHYNLVIKKSEKLNGSLSLQIAELTGNIERVEREKSDLLKRLDSAKIEADTYIREASKATSIQLADLRTMISELEHNNSSLNEQLRALRAESSNSIATLSAQIEGLSEKISHLEHEKKDLLERLNIAYSRARKSILDSANTASSQLAELRSVITGLEREKNSLIMQLAENQTESVQLNGSLSLQITALSENIERVEQEKEDLLKRLDSAKIEAETNIRDTANATSTQLGDLHTVIGGLEQNNRSLNDQLIALRAESSNSIGTLSAQIGGLSEKISHLEHEKKDLLERLNMADSQARKSILDSANTASSQLAELRSVITGLESEKNSLNMQLAESRTESQKINGSLSSQITALSENIERVEQEKEDLLKRLDSAKIEAETNIRENLGVFSAQILDLTLKISDIETENVELSKLASDRPSPEIEKMSQKLDSLEKENHQLLARLKETLGDTALLETSDTNSIYNYELQSKIESVSYERDDVFNQLDICRIELDRVSNEYSDVKTRFESLLIQFEKVQHERVQYMAQISELNEQVLKTNSFGQSDNLIFKQLEMPQLGKILESYSKIPLSDNNPNKLQKLLLIGDKQILKSATLPWYLSYLLEIADYDSILIYAFLLNHPIFTKSKDLLGMLLLKWIDLIKDQKQGHGVYMIRIANILKMWMQKFQNDINMNDSTAQYILSIIQVQPPDVRSNEVMQILTDTVSKRSQNGGESVRRSTVENKIPNRLSIMISKAFRGGKSTLKKRIDNNIIKEESSHKQLSGILDYDPVDVSRQITLNDFKYFKLVGPRELIDSNWTKKEKETLSPNICKLSEWTNSATMWIVSEILSVTDLIRRISILAHIIQIGQELVKLRNFNGLKMIMDALSLKPVARLKQTFQNLSQDSKNKLNYLKDVVDEKKNFVEIRNISKTTQTALIPYPGMYHHDLQALSALGDVVFREKNIKWINADRINKTTAVINSVLQHQKIEYEFEVSSELSDYLSNYQNIPLKDIDRISLKLDPES